MAKGIYMTVDNVVRKVPAAYMTVDNTVRKVPSGYMTVDNVVRQFHPAGTPLSDMEIAAGDSLYLNVDGVATEFIVVNVGNPNTNYYAGDADGIWLLQKDIWKTDYYHTSNVYSHRMHGLLTDNYLPLFDTSVRNIINTVKIPYWDGPSVTSSSGGNECSGDLGLEAKVFLLSLGETGGGASKSMDSQNADALQNVTTRLAYFTRTGYESQRRAYYNGELTGYWTRSPAYKQSYYNYVVTNIGTAARAGTGSTATNVIYGLRPALVLPYTALADDNGLIVG